MIGLVALSVAALLSIDSVDRLERRVAELERARRLELQDRRAAEWIAQRPAETDAQRRCRLADDSVRATRDGGPICGL